MTSTSNQSVASENILQHLLDHPLIPCVFRLKDEYGPASHTLRLAAAHDVSVKLYNTDSKDPYSSGLLELVELPRIDEWLEHDAEYVAYKKAHGGVDPFGPGGQPHLEIDFVPMLSDAFQWHISCPPEGDSLTVIVNLLRPLSKCSVVALKSADPLEDPIINLNSLENKLAIIVLRQGLRFVDTILMNGEGMKYIIGEDFPFPIPRNSDVGLTTMIKERSLTDFHPCGTCRVGKDVNQGVVDDRLNIFGVNKLRVFNASIVPVIPDCCIQNAVYMIEELCFPLLTGC